MDTELLSQYEIPYLHPQVVHFPFVMLLLAAGCALLYMAIGTRLWRRAVTLLLLLSVPAVWMAQESGERLLRDVEGEPMVERVVEFHEAAAEWTLWVSVLTLAVVGGLGFWMERRSRTNALRSSMSAKYREPPVVRIAVFLITLVPAVLVTYTAHLGGLMVWGVPTAGS